MIWIDEYTMKKHEVFKNLRKVLVDIFSSNNLARIIVYDAGMNPDHISFSGSAIEVWFEILAEAEKQNKIHSLLNVTLEHYPDNTILRSVTEEYFSWINHQELKSGEELSKESIGKVS